jgi:hypothetical protein
MPEIPLEWPRGGLNVNEAFADQPPLTCREGRNVRNLDPATGRARGGQREGMSRLRDDQVNGANKVARLVSVKVADNLLAYAAESTPEKAVLEQSITTPGKAQPLAIQTDSRGNVYVPNGNAGFVVLNPDFEEVAKVEAELPADALVRAFHVDPFGNVYIGTSTGEDPKKARLLRFEPRADDEYFQRWRLHGGDLSEDDPTGVESPFALLAGLVQDVKVRGTRMYTLQSDPTLGRTALVVYNAINSAVPFLESSRQVAHPSNALDLNDAGEVFVAAPPNPTRGSSPQDPDATGVSRDWDFHFDLEGASERVWAEIDARQLLDFGLKNDDDVETWFDVTGNDRGFGKFINNPMILPPKFVEKSVAGLPGVSFNGVDQGMRSKEASASSEKMSRSFLPGFTTGESNKPGSAWALFMIVTPDFLEEASGTTAKADAQRVLIAQSSQLFDAPSGTLLLAEVPHAVIINRRADPTPADLTSGFGNPFAANYERGAISYISPFAIEAAADGLRSFGPLGGNVLGTKPQTCLITIVNDGAHVGLDSTYRSTFRLNGRPIDSFKASIFSTSSGERTALGVNGGSTANYKNYAGLIHYAVVLKLTDKDKIGKDGFTNQPAPGEVGVVGMFNYPDAAFSQEDDSELRRIEGQIAHEWGIGHLLYNKIDFPHPWLGGPSAQQTTLHPKPSWGTPPKDKKIGNISNNWTLLNDKFNSLAKVVAGKVPWILRDSAVGFGVVVSQKLDDEGKRQDDVIYSLGPFVSPIFNPAVANARKLFDLGESFSLTDRDPAAPTLEPDDKGWTFSRNGGRDFRGNNYPRAASDIYGNLFVPVRDVPIDVDPTGAFPGVLVVLPEDATPSGAPEPTKVLVFTGIVPDGVFQPNDYKGYAVAIDPEIPNYGSLDDTIALPRRIFVATDQAVVVVDPFLPVQPTDPSKPTVHRVRLVNATNKTGSPRVVYDLAVAGGNIVRFQRDSAYTIPPGGAAALSAAPYIDATAIFGKVIFTDGLVYRIFDPFKSPPTGEISEYKSKNKGRIPPGCRLITTWRGRVVLAADPESPFGYHMSAIGDIFDWDFDPPVSRPDMAVQGITSEAGETPDIIRSLYPYNDDLLFLGCDSSVYRLTGDPALGGQLDKISRQVGTGFGHAFTEDKEGNVYFSAAQGGIFVIPSGSGRPVPLTEDRIERLLQDIDYSANFVELYWNYRARGLHVFVFPFGAGGVPLRHYFWDKTRDAWWEDTFGRAGATEVQPTAALVMDGDDPQDRRLLLGCEDGRLRVWDEDAADDDSSPIDSYVTMGPFAPAESFREWRFSHLKVVLAHNQQGVRYEMFASSEPDVLGIDETGFVPLVGARRSGYLRAGRNQTVLDRVRGDYVAVRLGNGNVGERWAMEKASIMANPAGRQRMRQVR